MLLGHLGLFIFSNLLLQLSFIGPRLLLQHHPLISLGLLGQNALRRFILNKSTFGFDSRHVGLSRLLRRLSFLLLLNVPLLRSLKFQSQLTITLLYLALLQLLQRLVVLLLTIETLSVNIALGKPHPVVM